MKLDTIKLKFNDGLSSRYVEAMHVGFVSDEDEIVHKVWLSCKDYLQDTYGVLYHNKGNCVGAGVYDYDSPRPSSTKMRLVVAGKIKGWEDRLGPTLDWLHYMEAKMGLTSSKVSRVITNDNNKCECFLFEGDVWWISSPVMISTYAMFIRLFSENKRNLTPREYLERIDRKIDAARDSSYYIGGKKTLDYLFKYGPEKLFTNNFADNFVHGTHVLHAYSGFSAFGTGGAKQYYPKWYERME